MKPTIIALTALLTTLTAYWATNFNLRGSIPSVAYSPDTAAAVSVAKEGDTITPQVNLNPRDSQSKSSQDNRSKDLLGLPFSQRFDQLLSYPTLQIKESNQLQNVRQVAWDQKQIAVMQTDGHLRFLPWELIQKAEVSLQPFQPSNSLELQIQLQQEFGPAFQIDRSRDFLVVSPRGSQQRWSNRMQQFLGNTQTYFSARKFPLKSHRFPLVAIVLPDEKQFRQYARDHSDTVAQNYVAYYSWKSNRIVLYETQNSSAAETTTIYHEAFHQIAFNTGIHFRSATPPRWIAEGMATAFETAGMYDHRKSTSRSDRLHPIYHRLAMEYLEQPGTAVELQALVQGDECFAIDPTRAYCLSWALCFYFMEFQPQAFAQYLEITNQRKAFSVYSEHQRLTDVQNLTPRGFDDLRKRLLNFYTASLSGQ